MIDYFSLQTIQILKDTESNLQVIDQPAITTFNIFYQIFSKKNFKFSNALKQNVKISKSKFDKYKNRICSTLKKSTGQGKLNSIKFVTLPFTKDTINMFKVAIYLMTLFKSETLEPEHLLLAICLDSANNTFAGQFLEQEGIDLNWLYEKIRIAMGLKPFLFAKNMYERLGHAIPKPIIIKIKATSESLKSYTVNITKRMNAKNLKRSIFGRSDEVLRLMSILIRRKKNNSILIGESGVGKTSIIEALALRVRTGDMPPKLKEIEILELDMNALISGTKYRGDFEERLQQLLIDLKKSKSFILVIDDIHKIIRSNQNDGSMDAGNMLKPALARSDFKCIGTTTLKDYRKIIQKDSAFDRRFQPIQVLEPKSEDCIKILKQFGNLLQFHHKVSIDEKAVIACIKFSDQYLLDRFLPDKAMDLLDEACTFSYSQMKTTSRVRISDKMQDEVNNISACKEECILRQEFFAAQRYLKLESKIKEQLKLKLKIAEKRCGENVFSIPEITEETISKIVSLWTGIPLNTLSKNEIEKLLNMEMILHKRIIGQNVAVNAIASALRRARSGLRDPNRPIASFIFAGPTGVGKTELVKTLTFFLFGSEESMVRLDMSEYMEKHTVSKLIGSPPGYIGHEQGGFLTEEVRKKPYSVVLFDEIEKAYPDIFNLLLQILDDGRLGDSNNRLIDFKNTIIILTSNIGSQAIIKETEIQIKDTNLDENTKYDRMVDVVLGELKKNFRPEFLNRLDEVIVFQQLNQNDIRKITDVLVKQLIERVQEKMKLFLIIEESVKTKLAQQGFDPLFGARPLKRTITNLIEDRLASLIIQNNFKAGTILHIELTKNQNIKISIIDNETIETEFDKKNKYTINNLNQILNNSINYFSAHGFTYLHDRISKRSKTLNTLKKIDEKIKAIYSKKS